MPKPICASCKRFYRPKKNGVYVLEGAPNNSNTEPGTSEEENWRPYKIWHADLWKCQGCDHELISGFGHRAVEEHDPRFKEGLPLITHRVNDC